VLIRLLSSFVQPYRAALLLVVALQLAGTMASLYLPSLNADIIDQGIARGDSAYILRTGGWMLLVTLIQVLCSMVAVYHGSRIAMGFGRDVRTAVFHRTPGPDWRGCDTTPSGSPSRC
jgi:ATP-binding cassette subfamily B multidrug efflux pump